MGLWGCKVKNSSIMLYSRFMFELEPGQMGTGGFRWCRVQGFMVRLYSHSIGAVVGADGHWGLWVVVQGSMVRLYSDSTFALEAGQVGTEGLGWCRVQGSSVGTASRFTLSWSRARWALGFEGFPFSQGHSFPDPPFSRSAAPSSTARASRRAFFPQYLGDLWADHKIHR